MTTLVLATGMDALRDNRVRYRKRMEQLPGATALTRLAELAADAGTELVTDDRYVPDGEPAALVLDLAAPPPRLPEGPAMAACFCLESPLIVHRLFHRFADATAPFAHTFTFPGAERLASPATTFHGVRWPNGRTAVDAGVPWADRAFAVLVSSNKRAHVWSPRTVEVRHPRQSLRVAHAALDARRWRQRDPWLAEELYVDRLELIDAFCEQPGFTLHGTGWEHPVRGTRAFDRAVRRSWQGRVDDKHAVLQHHRFTICFENTVFPGYLTEKLYDAVFAGSIPVYLGAPDIEALVPPELFVDARPYRGRYRELAEHLRAMPDDEVERRLAAAATFLASPAFEDATAERFASMIWDAVRSHLRT